MELKPLSAFLRLLGRDSSDENRRARGGGMERGGALLVRELGAHRIVCFELLRVPR